MADNGQFLKGRLLDSQGRLIPLNLSVDPVKIPETDDDVRLFGYDTLARPFYVKRSDIKPHITSLPGYDAKEHIDWTEDQSPVHVIHENNTTTSVLLACKVKAYVASNKTLTVNAREQIVVSERYDVDAGGTLIVKADGTQLVMA
jgi:hypothetical protein